MLPLVRLVLTILLIYVGLRLAVRFIRRLAAVPRRETVMAASDRTVAGEMVQDPVCGIYVPAHEGITTVSNGRVFHFCSEECRSTFEKDRAPRHDRQG